MKMYSKYVFLVLVVFVSSSISAQEVRLTLDQCFRLAEENNLTSVLAEKSVEQARTLQATAWDVDKTQLSLSQDPTSGGSPDNSLSLSQSFDFPTVYLARRSQLKAETQVARSRADLIGATLRGQIAETYYRLAFEQERVRLLSMQDSVLTRYRHLADQRLAVGETRRLEVLTAERLQRENQMNLAAAQSQQETTRLELASLLGTNLSVVPASEYAPANYAPSDYNFALSPEGRYANDRIRAAERAVSVARSGYAPSLSLSLRHQLVLSSWDPYHQKRSRFADGNFMGFEVGIGIPLFFGATKARVKAARESRDIAQLEMQQEQQLRQRDYTTALSRLRAAQLRLDYYTTEGEQKADELVRLGTLEYEQGEIGYVEYVDALQESIDLRLKRAEAINDYNQAVVCLQRLDNGFGK